MISLFTTILIVISHTPESYRTPADFAQEAKLAMAAKLFEMKRLSSGMAAALVDMDRVSFLAALHSHGVPMIDLDDEDLAQDNILS